MPHGVQRLVTEPVLPPICKSGFWEQPRLIRPRLYGSELHETQRSGYSAAAGGVRRRGSICTMLYYITYVTIVTLLYYTRLDYTLCGRVDRVMTNNCQSEHGALRAGRPLSLFCPVITFARCNTWTCVNKSCFATKLIQLNKWWLPTHEYGRFPTVTGIDVWSAPSQVLASKRRSFPKKGDPQKLVSWRSFAEKTVVETNRPHMCLSVLIN